MLTGMLIIGLGASLIHFIVYKRCLGRYSRQKLYMAADTATVWTVMFVLACTLAVVGHLLIAPPLEGEIIHHEQEIVAVSSGGSETSGYIGIFGGSVDTKQLYVYYIERGDGGVVQQTIGARGTVIYEDSTEGGSLTWKECVTEPFRWIDPRPRMRTCEGGPPIRYDYDHAFHVPPGSVVRDFTIE